MPSGSTFLPSHSYSCIPFKLVWSIYFLCSICYHKIYTCYCIMYYQFLLLLSFHSLRVCHTSVRVTASLQHSSEYSPILTMLWFGCSWIFLIPNFSSLFPKLLGTVANTPVIISITITFMFHSFFSSLARFEYLFIFLLSIIFSLWSARTAKSTRCKVLFFFLINTRFSPLAEIRWSVCMSKSQRIFII